MSVKVLKGMSYFFNKAWRLMYDQIIVNRDIIDEVKNMNRNCPLIICPTHRSYVDFLIMSYVFFHYNLQAPHICAGEDFLSIAVVHHILRFCGAFFMRRSFKDDPLYRVLFK